MPKGFVVYATRDYRVALRQLVETRRLTNVAVSFQSLAEVARIPKSYLSKVLGGDANLSNDQAYAIAKSLGLDSEEVRYLVLLVEFERSGLDERRKELMSEIAVIQESHLQTKEHLPSKEVLSSESDLSQFYLTPWAPIVHVSLTIPRFARNPLALQAILGIEPQEFQKTLRLLESLKLIIPATRGYQVEIPNFHLPPDSPAYRSWRAQQDILVSHAMLVKRDPKHYGFSVSFAAKESIRMEIRKRFLEFLGGVKELCDKSEPEEVYHMKFDVFSWTK
jgi:uncharacterized protein (TIGR02147 family)